MSWRSISISIRVVLLTAVLAIAPRVAFAQVINADVSISTAGGYARMVFLFAETIEPEVRLSNNILIVNFKTQVDAGVELLATGNEYVSAVRRDPDGKGIRLALMRKVRVSSMVAGERLFVDLLPESWTGPPPPLPQEVVEDLARRTREAEKRAQVNLAQSKQRPPSASRVRISRQPTFTRYVFELPEFIAVNADRAKDKLRLVFDGVIRFDLADAKVMQPPMVSAIEAKPGDNSTMVGITFIGKVDVRSFREDNNYVVDIVTTEGSPKQEESSLPPIVPPGAAGSETPVPASKAEEIVMPRTTPARPETKPESDKPATPPRPVTELVPILKLPATAAAPPVIAQAEAVPVNTPPETPAASLKAAPKLEPIAAAMDKASEAKSEEKAGATAVEPVSMKRQADNTYLLFPFSAPTPAAAFVRADTLWLVFDTDAPVDLGSIKSDAILDASVVRSGDVQLVRVKLSRPRLVSLTPEDNNWAVNIGDTVVSQSQPLGVMRNIISEVRASANVPFEDPRNLRRIQDPEIGDTLLVVTAFGPARGVPKTQDFVDFRALASVQGVVIQPLADDIRVELSADRVMIARPGGLTLTSSSPTGRRNGALRPMMFDSQQWGYDRQSEFLPRKTALINAASKAADNKRNGSRLELARFYFARDMYAEAKGVLDVVLEEEKATAEDSTGLVMRGVANIMMGRTQDGLKDITNTAVGMQNDAALWRALASAKQGKWPEAREGFRKTEVAIGMLPLQLQREIYKEVVQAAIEVGDFGGAATQLGEFESLNIPPEMQAEFSVLTGRIHEGLGRNADALQAYRSAAESTERASAAQGRLREIALRFRLGDMPRTEVVTELENLTSVWRGDETEVEALQLLARLYTEEKRYRDAFNIMRTALQVHPDSDRTRTIQDDAATAFNGLFLGGKGDAMPAIEALSLFYDFREMTPIGRKGDEMIRRLADRLVAVDLLDQAAELLQHQVDHRLQGAARAQVATRLAVIYLMNRKPDRALGLLKSTRTSELPNEIRNQRLLIEARALSDIGRHSLAIEVIENVDTPEGARTRSDLFWAAKQFRESAEQIELLYANRWKDFAAYNEVERRDILRAAMGFSLAEDKIGLERFKEKFAPGMMLSPDRRSFEVVTAPRITATDEFNEIARNIAAVDTLGQFLRDIRSGADQAAAGASAPLPKPNSQTKLSKPDYAPTGKIPKPIATSAR